MTKKALKEEFNRLHEEVVERASVIYDEGWTQQREQELYLTHASSYDSAYLYDDIEDDLVILIQRLKKELEYMKELEEMEEEEEDE